MLAVYEQGEDLHRKTAAAFLGKEPSAVSKAERQIAKGINFGMLFGSGAKGLQAFCKSSYGVDLSLAQADKARAAFFAAYPGLSAWQKQTRKAAELAKQVRTPGGRVRGLEKNIGTECLNTPVQGGAAECLLATLAALDVDSLGGRLVNIVHDELVVEAAPEQADAVSAAVEAAMVAGFLAIFPSGSTRDLVEAHSGPNWASAKG
jgi:DNA polymerase-1